MNCCPNCFIDPEIIAIVEASKSKGTCDFCKKTNVCIYDLEKDTTLSDTFEGLLEIFTPVKDLPKSYPKNKSDLLKNILYSQWRIFRVQPDVIYHLITSICKEKYDESPEIFDEPVGIWQLYDNDFLNQNAVITNYSWKEFVEAIKYSNRFHTNYINEDILNLFIRCVRKTYPSDSIFYRARICSNTNGYKPDDMMAPPQGHASAGRTNPEGISMLYLADSARTTLHEIRAGVFDYVTVGTFKLCTDIDVINLANIDKISPFIAANSYGIDFIRQAVNIDNLKVISQEIAKPLRRHDSTLDYLPTQYISDFIKSKNYSGIEYASTMCQGGMNIAVYDQSLLKCVSVTVYDIKSLNYDFDIV